MASVLHGSARTTPRMRAELQALKESSRALAAAYGLNPKTIAKWRGRAGTADAPQGGQEHGPDTGRGGDRSRISPPNAVTARRCPGLPARQDPEPQPLRPASLPATAWHLSTTTAETAQTRRRFKTYEIGYVHIDSCELHHAGGKLIMFLAIDRVSKFTYVESHDREGKMEGSAFLRNAVAAFPYKIHTVLTDNGMAFADLPRNRTGPIRQFLGPHIFDRVCIEHRLTKPYHPWTNGQAERMNRAVKDATVKVLHYGDFESLKAHVLAFVAAYNFAKHLKALHWKTPFQTVCQAWTDDPSRFRINPHHLIPGPYI